MSWQNETLLNQLDTNPKEIFSAYCQEIGNQFLDVGFKFIKSRPRIDRTKGDIIESINFWSSRNNEINHCVSLEILPYVKSKSLKKWIKQNSIGRNEYIYFVEVNTPRNLNIFGHTYSDFIKLTKNIKQEIVTKLEFFSKGLDDLNYLLESNEFDQEIIADNFMAFVCMTDKSLIDKALEKYSSKIEKHKLEDIYKYKEASC